METGLSSFSRLKGPSGSIAKAAVWMLMLLCGLQAFAGEDAAAPLDPRSLGATCDATYDPATGRISGTDDTPALAVALHSMPLLGGTIRIPGLCRITSGLTVASNMVTIVGFGGFLHSNSQTPTTGIVFDSRKGVALTVEGGTFKMRDTSVLSRRGVSAAVLVTGGNSVFENVKIFGIEGACPGCNPTETDGSGIQFSGVQSNVEILHSQIAGYNVGVDAESAAAFTILGRSQFMSNNINVRVGNGRGATQVMIQDADLQDAVVGNIDIVRAVTMTMNHNYFEIGSHHSPFNVRIGRDTGDAPTSVSYRGNYLHCNDNAQTPAIILSAVNGWTQEDNTFNSCPGVIVSNEGTASFGLRFANDTFLGALPRAYVTTNRGVASLTGSRGGTYLSALHDDDDALSTGTGRLNLNGACRIRTGAGEPNGVQTGDPCDIYLNTTGGEGGVLWVKETGKKTNAGWVVK
jgi:hypothetical protein